MFKIRNLSRKSLDEFQASEYGSYEDYLGGETSAVCVPEGWDGPVTHTVEVLDRFRCILHIKNVQELEDVWYSLCTGTFQHLYLKRAQTIAKKLLPHVQEHCPHILEQWPYPDGN